MAEKEGTFCVHCAKNIAEEITPDVDVKKIFETLDEEEIYSGFLCEGCGVFMVTKKEGNLKVQYLPEDNKHSVWEDYTEEKCIDRFNKGLLEG